MKQTLLQWINTKHKLGILHWIQYYYFNILNAIYRKNEPKFIKLEHNPKVKTTYPTVSWKNLTEFERSKLQFSHYKELNLFFKT